MKKLFPKTSGFLIAAAVVLTTFSACNSDDYSQQDHADPTHIDHVPSDTELTRAADTMMVDKTRVDLDSADRMRPVNMDTMRKSAKDSADRVHPGKSDKH
ncbi:MAG: hypothetical protein V4725_06430 [Bacteroidota bacterium]|nr:hypothetical protein [Ferruginibacter sp.]